MGCFHLWFCGSDKNVPKGDIWILHRLEYEVQSNGFEAYKSLFCVKHVSIIMHWITNLNTRVEHFAFDVNQQHIWAIRFNMQICEVSYVIREVYVITIT